MKLRTRRNLRRGLTMTEMMVSVTLFTFIGLFVAYVTLLVARQVHRSLFMIPAEQRAYRMMDQMRNELMAAEAGTVTIDVDANGLTYRNPARANNSRIWVNSSSNCMWLSDVTVPNEEIKFGPVVDCTFTLSATGRQIGIEIQTYSKDRTNEYVPMTYSDVVTLRN